MIQQAGPGCAVSAQVFVDEVGCPPDAVFGAYALRGSVGGNDGSGGEFLLTGHAALTDDPALRALAARYGYAPQAHYILFELSVESAFSTTYAVGSKPVRVRWRG